jgi:hypothetical protein
VQRSLVPGWFAGSFGLFRFCSLVHLVPYSAAGDTGQARSRKYTGLQTIQRKPCVRVRI